MVKAKIREKLSKVQQVKGQRRRKWNLEKFKNEKSRGGTGREWTKYWNSEKENE